MAPTIDLGAWSMALMLWLPFELLLLAIRYSPLDIDSCFTPGNQHDSQELLAFSSLVCHQSKHNL